SHNSERVRRETSVQFLKRFYSKILQISAMSVFNSFMEDVYLHQYVKIALAVAIIKRKPKDVTTKLYIEDLLKILQIQDGNRNRKVVELDKRLLEGQRDLMSIVLSKPELELESSHADARKECASVTLSNVERCMHLLKNAPFHHEGSENPMLFLEDGSVLKSTLLGALEFLTMATLQSKEALPVPKQMYQACIIKLEGLSSIVDDYSKIKSRVEQMVDSLLHYLLQLRSPSPCEEAEDVKDILLSVGSSPLFRDVCLFRLTQQVSGFASTLRPVAKGEEEFSTKVSKYNNICHVLFVLEQILRDASINPSLKTVQEIHHQLNSALLHISQAFPVFSHFLWRLQVFLIQLCPISKPLK
ncbi:unnamed protein product, partial [Porites evermanni]